MGTTALLQFLIGLVTGVTAGVAAVQNTLGQVMNLLQAILTNAQDGAKEHAQFEIETNTQFIINELGNATYGLAALKTAINALGGPQQATQPVILPTVPPAGYGAPSSSSNAAAVWAFVSTDEATQMGNIMSFMSVFLRAVEDGLSFNGRFASGFRYNFSPQLLVNNPSTGFPEFSTNTILPTHLNIMDWLTDQYPTVTWRTLGDGTIYATFASGNALAYCTLTEGEFEWLRMLAGGPKAKGSPEVPPVWPGIAGVTLGTPVTIVDPSFTVPGPMDGVLVDITSVSVAKPYYDFDGRISRKYIGQIAFISDNGDVEHFQSLGFDLAIYVPLSMQQADHCNIHLDSGGIVGTVTPWTRT